MGGVARQTSFFHVVIRAYQNKVCSVMYLIPLNPLSVCSLVRQFVRLSICLSVSPAKSLLITLWAQRALLLQLKAAALRRKEFLVF